MRREMTATTHHPTLLKNYGAPSIDIVRGEGLYVFDTEGKRYLDFGSGIAVTSVGHSHPHWVDAVQKQAATLTHCSNLYGIPEQKRLADRLVKKAGSGRVLFCNSGAEANEGLLKLARLYGRHTSGREGKRYGVITANHAFHGRTFGGMAATPQEKIQSGFRPMLEGFRHADLNDIDSFDQAVDETTAAVFIESIQGEGGIYPAETQFLRDLRKLCDEREILLMIDEVQCGIGRSGNFFAYQESGVIPDAIGMAKGLAGGFPIGAIWVRDAFAHLFQPGSHGTTFGGSPLACSAAHATLDIIEDELLIDRVQKQSIDWHADLKNLKALFPKLIQTVRGRGYMVGIQLQGDCSNLSVSQIAREHGLLIVPAGSNVIRLLPALTASKEQLAMSIDTLREVFQSLS